MEQNRTELRVQGTADRPEAGDGGILRAEICGGKEEREEEVEEEDMAEMEDEEETGDIATDRSRSVARAPAC